MALKASAAPAPSEALRPLRAKILIVDDDERNAFAAAQALEELGHELVVARSGEEALRRLLDDDFAVILLDLHMPGMDGYETASLIRSRRKTSRTPIVFLTAIFRDEAHIFQGYSAGAVDVVFKPVDPFILRSKVSVLAELHLTTLEVERRAEQQRQLLEENARVREEKLKAERQLAQAQKMEAVGQLTGGIAHDFNNLLTVILGNVDLLSRKMTAESRTRRQLSAVRHAAERGRSLTRQLLAFSRRQQLSPVVVDVNKLLIDFLPLLRQAVGESITLEVPTRDDPFCVHVDPAQLEGALLNLAVNARDAMPEGGVLSISARRIGRSELSKDTLAHLEGDSFISIEVRDTGVGMSREVRQRVFEPFFTTKDVGKGSGLGLAQVYGFVRQSGGHITLDSAPGAGTTFRIYLQASADAPVHHTPAPTLSAHELAGDGERILVVEDDPAVLALTVEMLNGLNYRVLTATTAQAALDLLGTGECVDLVFSDVVMPGGVSGVQLGHAVREICPGTKVLLTSGYTGHGAAHDERAGFDLIDKPYERLALAAKIRQLLGEEEPPIRGLALDALGPAEPPPLESAR